MCPYDLLSIKICTFGFLKIHMYEYFRRKGGFQRGVSLVKNDNKAIIKRYPFQKIKSNISAQLAYSASLPTNIPLYPNQ